MTRGEVSILVPRPQLIPHPLSPFGEFLQIGFTTNDSELAPDQHNGGILVAARDAEGLRKVKEISDFKRYRMKNLVFGPKQKKYAVRTNVLCLEFDFQCCTSHNSNFSVPFSR